jgi:hypothetical protein
MAVDPLPGLAGVLLLYVAPGLGLAAALFPERFRPARERGRAWLEVATLAFVLSLAVTILFGEMLQASTTGFSASWSSPTLEFLDGIVAAMGLGVGAVRGAFSRDPLPEVSPEPSEAATWPTLRELEHLTLEERRLKRALRSEGLAPAERSRLEAERLEVEEARRAVLRRREVELAA